MIKNIIMKNCATYPSEGSSIENCQKINFFYGPNGSGKSNVVDSISWVLGEQSVKNLRGSKEYRSHLVNVLTGRALAQLED